jgi:hypothetical protein
VCLSSTKFEQEREGWLFAISKGEWSILSDGTFDFGHSSSRTITIGKHAARFFDNDYLGQSIVARHILGRGNSQASPDIRVILDDANQAQKFSQVDFNALQDYYRHATGNNLFQMQAGPNIKWLKAFYSQAAGQFLHVGDSVFLDVHVAKISRIIRHERLGKFHTHPEYS